MLRIGEFAWLSQVTVETLRHYDRIGLLKPVHLDRFTGYRYYSLDQLPRLNRILALKDLGLPLKEIARMLDQEITADEIRGILGVKQAELEEQVQEARRRLARIEARLQEIQREGKMPEHEVLLKTVEAPWIASVRKTIDRERMRLRLIGRRLQEGFSFTEQNAIVWGIMVSVGVAMLGEVGAMKVLFVPFLQGEIGMEPEGGDGRDAA